MRGIGLCAIVAACLAVTATGCSKKQDTASPVANPSLMLSRADPSIGGPLDVTYTFTIPADAPAIPGNYTVFVHFLDRDGEMMWTDDHVPSPPTRDWKPGTAIHYTHTIFVPKIQYVGDGSVEMGLYLPKTGQRLPLAGQDMGMRSYRVAAFAVRPQPENSVVVLQSGWHDAETGPPGSSTEWQWSTGLATFSFRNPRTDAVLYLDYDQPVAALGLAQHVDLRAGETTVDSFDVPPGSQKQLRRIPLTTTQLGTDRLVTVTMTVSHAFVPARMPELKSSDPRELGIRVFHAYLQPK